jgi:hypothetical protein
VPFSVCGLARRLERSLGRGIDAVLRRMKKAVRRAGVTQRADLAQVCAVERRDVDDGQGGHSLLRTMNRSGVW